MAANSSIASSTIPGQSRYQVLQASRAWKKASGFCAVPRMTGASGVSARARCCSTSASGIIRRRSASSSISIFDTSCEVRKPSKKCRKGMRLRIEARCAMAAKSWASCTLPEQSRPNPVCRTAITSW